MIVAKFGGTSMGTADSIRQVAEIVRSAGEVAVVVSASSGTTDGLIELGRLAVSGGEWREKLEALVEKHRVIMEGLSVSADLAAFWRDIENLLLGVSLMQDLSLSAADRLCGYGERVSSVILAAYLNGLGVKAEAVNAFDLVFTDNNYGEGNVDFERSYAATAQRLGSLISDGVVPVVTGFIGQSAEGKYIVLGRGGSDYSGAIVAAALGARELQIWTDVDGILSADPRIVAGARVLSTVSFEEASELAYFGAKVLHPKTIKPAVQKGVPVRILNTFNPQAVGTVIVEKSDDSLKSVTYRNGVMIVNICAAEILEAYGSLAKIFEVFGRHKIVVDVVSTSEVSVSLTVDGLPQAVLAELEEFATVEVEEGVAIVCLVGNGIARNPHVLGQLFGSIDGHDVRMVSQGASKRNITFLVRESEVVEVVGKVFNKFFS